MKTKHVLSAIPTYWEDYWEKVDYFCSIEYAQSFSEAIYEDTRMVIKPEKIMESFAEARSELKREAEKDQLLLPLEEV